MISGIGPCPNRLVGDHNPFAFASCDNRLNPGSNRFKFILFRHNGCNRETPNSGDAVSAVNL